MRAPGLTILRPLATTVLLLAGLLGGCLGGGPSAGPQAGSSAGSPPAADQPMAFAVQAGETRTFRIVPQQSKASYEAQEKWASWSVPNKAVANTNDVEGELVLITGDQPKLAANRFRVDLRTLVSEVGETPMGIRGLIGPAALVLSVRDRAVRESLAAHQSPFAEFTATELEGLPARYIDGQAVKVRVPGNLTIRGVTRAVAFDTEATLRRRP